MSKLFEKLDKILMAVFAAGALAVVFFVYRDDLPGLKKKYQDAATESQKDWGDGGDTDPEGYVTVGAIRDGKFTYVRMKRKERDALWGQRNGGR